MIRPFLRDRLIHLALAAALLCGCSPDYEVPLPNGYRLVRANSYETFVSGPDRLVVVAGKVIKYGVYDALVLGYVDWPEWPNPQPSDLQDVVVGYFILDTRTQQVIRGLAEPEWRARLSQLGVKALPPLVEPHHPLIPWLAEVDDEPLVIAIAFANARAEGALSPPR